MDPSTTGRRHPRSGSVSVAELIRNHPHLRTREAIESERFVEELLGPDRPSAPEGPGKAVQLLRFVLVSVGVLVVCGAVGAASVIVSARPHIPTAAAAPTPTEITGPTVLRPDLLHGTLTTPAHPAVARTLRAAPPTTPPAGFEPFIRGAETRPITTDPSASGLGSGVEVVREFYRLLSSEPAAAFALLDQQMVGNDPLGFVSSWRTVRAVRLARVEPGRDGSVRVSVSMQRPEGDWLHTEQLLTVSRTSPPRIVGAQLLSAQHG
ncbi:hypothetical protein GCM10012275_32480 [Longimycelium tulufanense]|uniref:Uncharacterized protein n=1 Tax=Longimycelium tulufanense TaxID=907463 RepID=A0A8J3FVK8_9PSEU|nr:hypothetical protein [Longimycelium tulufanense]GGM58807.1 hypothetical protein GCM10012275_32480 [Longimycelium tulufanense]